MPFNFQRFWTLLYYKKWSWLSGGEFFLKAGWLSWHPVVPKLLYTTNLLLLPQYRKCGA